MALFRRKRHEEERADSPISIADYARLWEQFSWNGLQYIVPGGNIEELTALQAQRNPVVASAIYVRSSVLSEATFAWQGWAAGRPGSLFGNTDLAILENPWPNATSGDLIGVMDLDASLYGNSYWVRDGQWLVRLDPTRMIIVTGDTTHDITGRSYGKQLLGYSEVDDHGQQVGFWFPDEICHYKPLKDPNNIFRGQSWICTLLPDIQADQSLTQYKNGFLQNAATPNLVVKFDPGVSEDAFLKFKEKMTARHTGMDNAFKTLYLGAGADVQSVGSNFQELLINDVQAAGETRIAAAAGVPPAILSLSEGMKGSALNSGNYAATRRRFSDITIRPLWRAMCGSLSVIVPPPHGGSRLWYDDRDITFLQADITDAAAVLQQNATSIRTLTDGGYDPDTIIQAVITGDLSLLRHTGLLTVQLQPITEKSAEDGDATTAANAQEPPALTP